MTEGLLKSRRGRKSHPSKWTNQRLAEACRFAKDLASSDVLRAALEESAKRLESKTDEETSRVSHSSLRDNVDRD